MVLIADTRSLLARILNTQGNKVENVSQNSVLMNISKLTVLMLSFVDKVKHTTAKGS